MPQLDREYVPETRQDDTANLENKPIDAANATKHRLQQMSRNVQAKIDGTRGPTADKLKSAASTIHEKTDRIAGLAHGAADKLQSTADYVREHDAQGMMADITGYVRNHPGRSLLAGAAAVLLLSRTIRRR
jgi:ElaB/YqjD/DUF883 family membrane-anchored ribosome-binding protein